MLLIRPRTLLFACLLATAASASAQRATVRAPISVDFSRATKAISNAEWRELDSIVRVCRRLETGDEEFVRCVQRSLDALRRLEPRYRDIRIHIMT